MSSPSIEEISFRNLGFSYEGQGPVLEDCNFDFPMGQVVLVEGGSGTGRSTLLKLLAGLAQPKAGQYCINQSIVSEMSFEEFLPLRHQIGYSFDFGGLFANRTLWENMTLPLLYQNALPAEEIEERVSFLTKKFGFWDARGRRPAEVSGGMRKACVVARAFVMHPQMLLMDDPFVALTEDMVDLVMDLVGAFRKQGRLKHVFLTTRDDRALRRTEHCRIFIENKKLLMREQVGGKVVNL